MTSRVFSPAGLLPKLRRVLRNDQLILSVLSLIVGLIAGALVVAFREGVLFFHNLFFNAPNERLYVYADALAWWQLLLITTLGGLAVGLLIRFIMPENRSLGVADVIEASALLGGRMSLVAGLRGALVNTLSIGVGASVGREGPAVHLGAAAAAGIAQRLHLTRTQTRTLLGCGVAAAVAASFNAPLAGALFAGEVVIGHYALRTFAPVVIASVAGTALSRSYFGAFPAFVLPPHAVVSYLELPAFLILGVLAGFVATVMLRGIFKAQDVAQTLPVPAWAHPALAGFALGMLALVLPQVLGVGYGATDDALGGQMALGLLTAVLVGKMLATVVCLGFGFGGGIFSPSLVIGAMLGGAYGIVAMDMFPALSTDTSGYTLVGMGAVAGAALGAPISTTLIIFEMTGDYELTLGVMLSVVVSSAITRHFLGANFFTMQLARRGLNLKDGFEAELLRAGKIAEVMVDTEDRVPPGMPLAELRLRLQDCCCGKLFVVDDDGKLLGTITLADLSETAFDPSLNPLINAADAARRHPPVLRLSDNLETALRKMSDSGESLLAVVDDAESCEFLGAVDEKHVMVAYNRALLQSRHEERDH